jgi:hypothetical protein
MKCLGCHQEKVRKNASFFSDYWQAYIKAFAEEEHFGVGKGSGLTA